MSNHHASLRWSVIALVPVVVLLLAAGCSRSPELDLVNGFDAFDKERDYPTAIEGFDRYLEREPYGEHAAGALFYKSMSHLYLNQRDLALATLTRLTSRFPLSEYYSQAQMHRGNILQEQGKIDEAAAAFDQLRQSAQNPTMAGEAVNRIAHLYVNNDQVEDAVAYIRSATDVFYDKMKQYSDISTVYQAAGQRAERRDAGSGRAHFEQAIQVLREMAQAEWADESARGVGMLSEAVIHAEHLNDTETALRIIHELRERHPQSEIALTSRVEEAWLLKRHDPAAYVQATSRAVEAYEAVIEDVTDPQHLAWYRNRIGEAYVRWDELERAIEVYDQIAMDFSAYPNLWQQADARIAELQATLRAREQREQESDDDDDAQRSQPASDAHSPAVGSVSP